MSLIFCDSFDHYTAFGDKGWTATNASFTPSITSSVGRRSTSALDGTASIPHTRGVYRSFSAAASMTVGLAFQIATFTDSSTQNYICGFADSGTDQMALKLNSSRQIEVRRGTTLLATSTEAINTGAFHYIEFQVTINNSTGAYEVRLDGVSVLSDSGIDTQATANATVNELAVGGRRSANTGPPTRWLIDDLYLFAGTTFLGDVRVNAHFPSGNGNSSDLVGSDSNSTDNYLLVDETSPDDDTTYVESDVVGDHDSYVFPDLDHTASSIFGLQITMVAKKDDAGSRSINAVVRSGSTDYDQASSALSTSYAQIRTIVDEDPDTSAAWTESGFNAAEFGPKVAA